MSPENWKYFIQNNVEAGVPESVFEPYKKYMTQDSMNIKDAVNFLKKKSPEKDEVLKLLFGEDKYYRFNFLPVSKFVLPVNKANAVKSGIISAKDAAKAVDYITIDYKRGNMFKADYMLMDILANFDWKRPINFSTGGIYEDQNIFFLNNYLQFDGFSYRLVPIKTDETEDGEMGRVDADNLYNVVKNYRWGNFKDLKVHFDETCTSNIVSYRSSASRAAEALILEGKKAKALEILDLASKEIPSSKYNDPRSLSSMVYGYIVAGQEKKGLQLAEQLKKDIFQEYDYYLSLSTYEQQYVKKQMGAQPILYSIVVSSVSNAYKKIGKEDKAYDYLVKSITPIDKRFNTFIGDLKEMGKEKAQDEIENVRKVTPFYSYLFEVMKPYDSTYSNEKQAEIQRQLIEATK
jgi:tetratricopeptide (TPR) repeat protein